MPKVDTIFNSSSMRPAFVGDPAEVRRLLKKRHPEDWNLICVGETGQMVTVAEYLYEEKYLDVMAMLRELLRKQGLSLYRRHPEKLETYLESTALKIIKRVLKDQGEK